MLHNSLFRRILQPESIFRPIGVHSGGQASSRPESGQLATMATTAMMARGGDGDEATMATGLSSRYVVKARLGDRYVTLRYVS